MAHNALRRRLQECLEYYDITGEFRMVDLVVADLRRAFDALGGPVPDQSFPGRVVLDMLEPPAYHEFIPVVELSSEPYPLEPISTSISESARIDEETWADLGRPDDHDIARAEGEGMI